MNTNTNVALFHTERIKKAIFSSQYGTNFEVTVMYHKFYDGSTEIMWYELEGIEQSREDLVELFSEETINKLEQDL